MFVTPYTTITTFATPCTTIMFATPCTTIAMFFTLCTTITTFVTPYNSITAFVTPCTTITMFITPYTTITAFLTPYTKSLRSLHPTLQSLRLLHHTLQSLRSLHPTLQSLRSLHPTLQFVDFKNFLTFFISWVCESLIYFDKSITQYLYWQYNLYCQYNLYWEYNSYCSEIFCGRGQQTPSFCMRHVLQSCVDRYALEHLSRVCRILSMPCGSGLLIGVGGSGRRSLTQLASAIHGNTFFQPAVCKAYGLFITIVNMWWK
jgi:hypothetical protein